VEWADLLVFAARRFDEIGIPYFVTGSSASITFGEPRMTTDVDIVAKLTPGHVEPLCAAFPSPEFYLSKPAIEGAIRLRSMFNILHPASGLKVDVSIAERSEFNAARFARIVRSRREEGYEVPFASPEDVILMKLEFYRIGASEKHLRDISGILRICQRPLDLAYIESWAARLNVTDVWQLVLRKVEEEKARHDPS
jgi:hypothetical protein